MHDHNFVYKTTRGMKNNNCTGFSHEAPFKSGKRVSPGIRFGCITGFYHLFAKSLDIAVNGDILKFSVLAQSWECR